MDRCLSIQDQERRKIIVEHARSMITRALPVEDEDETSLMLAYSGFYLQVSFTELHPLMVIYLARGLARPSTAEDKRLANELNLKNILGTHAINDEIGCYFFRMTHWLDTHIIRNRFLEILDRCSDEAERGYAHLAKAG